MTHEKETNGKGHGTPTQLPKSSTISGPMGLKERLDEWEQGAKIDSRKSFMGISFVSQAKQKLTLVKALRRAMDALPDDKISRESWWYEQEAQDALVDITAILNEARGGSSVEPKATKSEAGSEFPKFAVGVSANVHVEHFFPKGYDPKAEPWASISHFCASIQRVADLGNQETQ